MDGKGHPLPRSDEARHNEIPEHLARDKGRGDDSRALVQPGDDPVGPDGEPYRYGDLGRGPGSARPRRGIMAETRRDDPSDKLPRNREQGGSRGADAPGRGGDELRRDQAEHQDRGQSAAEAETDTE